MLLAMLGEAWEFNRFIKFCLRLVQLGGFNVLLTFRIT